MDNNKSKLLLKETPKRFSDKRMILQIVNNKVKRKIDRMSSVNLKSTLSNKPNKKSLNIISTYQGKYLIPTIFKGNKENNINSGKNITNTNRKLSVKRDKNYYLNLLNDIYLNDSHLSNNNFSKKSNNILNNNNDSIKVNKNFIKKQTFNFSQIKGRNSSKDMLRKSCQSSKKVLSTFSNEKMNKSNNLSINPSKDNIPKSNRKQSNFSKNIINKRPITKFLSEKAVSKFKTNEESSKAKMKEKNKNFKTSQIIINEVEYINESLKDEKGEKEENNGNNENNDTIQKEFNQLKLNINNNENNMRNSQRSRNTENDNLSKNNAKNNSIIMNSV